MKKINRAYNYLLERFIKKFFPIWERMGFHITINNFYEPVPDIRTLEDYLWQKQSELIGIDINEQQQLHFLSQFSEQFKEEYQNLPKDKPSISYQYYVNNGVFESVDGEILYCMIRYFKPKKIIEIGSGYSTYLSAQTILKNKQETGNECDLIAIEPYPNNTLKAGFPGLSKLISSQIQNVSLSEFNKLKKDDFLFIDSSHVLKIGSDVQYEYLEILPRLNKGVIVHIHDIFLPADYRKEWILKDYRFWTEQYLLQAFLTFNDSYEILWGGSYMHLKHPDKLEVAFNTYDKNKSWPGSFWIKKVR